MSIYQLPLTWRGRTELGIPYKVLSLEGSCERNKESVTETILLPAILLRYFLAESFPPVKVVDNRPVWQNRAYPGAEQLRAQRISWKSHIPGQPTDPYIVDPLGIKLGSYHMILEVTIEYGNLEQESVLEIRGGASGEYVHVSAPKATFEGEQNRQATVPVAFMVPETEWTVTVSGVPREWFQTTLLPKLRSQLGKVNDTIVYQLYEAPIETILFCGYNTTQSWTRAAGSELPKPEEFDPEILELFQESIEGVIQVDETSEQPLVNVELKFVEKNFVEALAGGGERVRGHNDFWVHDKGWQYLLIDGVRPLHLKTDLNDIFQMIV